jgi:hypothetical protein
MPSRLIQRLERLKMKIHWFPFALIATTLIAACGATAPASDSAAQNAGPASTQPPVTRVANPLNVKVTTDTDLAASALITTAGGTLSVEAADGTQFTLTFPEGALQSDETITLTPVSGVEGSPFSGGLVGGVQMAPEGLRLFQPATLTIESPNTVAAEGFETVAFGYHEDGQGVYLNPSTIAGSILTLEVWHFSGIAAAQATTAEIQTQQQQNVPSDAEDAFTQGIQELEGIERQAQQLGEPDPDFKDRMKEFLRQAYESFIAPQLPIALEDCAKAPEIISKALGWARQAEFLAGNELRAQIDNVIATYEQVKEKCNQNYTGEGKFRTSGEQSALQVVSGYTFQITFRANADGAINGEGVIQKVEASMGSQDFQCTDPGFSALVFPPMRITGTTTLDAAGQPATFHLTLVGPASTSTSQYTCTHPIAGTWTLDAVPDQGFFIENVEIDAADGAQAQSENTTETFGTTVVTAWELVIHKQANP